MKKRLFTLALALCLVLCVPAFAGDMGRAGEYNIISAGSNHVAAVDENGDLWMWGENYRGQLGNGGQWNTIYHDILYDINYPIQTVPVKVLGNVAAVSCGVYHTAAIKTDGSLWMWGSNASGELGNGCQGNDSYADTMNGINNYLSQTVPVKVMDNVAAVNCGGAYTAVIKTDGSLWMWGYNQYGQLGNSSTEDSPVPIKVLDNVAAVSCGSVHTAAIKTDGSLWTWGSNSYGELGNGKTDDSKVPVKVLDNVATVSCSSSTTAAIKTDGSLWMWGYNDIDQLSNDGQGNDWFFSSSLIQTVPIKVLDDVAAVSYRDNDLAVIKADGSLWMCGRNACGALGIGTTEWSRVPVKVMDDVAAVSCGHNHTIAVKTDGTLWTWGDNRNGQLGNGGTGNETDYFGSYYQTVPAQITLGNGAHMSRGVRLYLNGGIGGGHLWTSADGTITVPTNPTKEGYTFGGWYTDEALTKPWNFNDKVTSTLVLYAGWVPVSSNSTTTDKSSQTISLNGKIVSLDAYNLTADNGGDVTYVKLRDVAALLDGTSSQFDVDWRNKTIYIVTGIPYIHRAGSELQTIRGTDGTFHWNTAPILIDGITSPLEGIVITDGDGGDHTFFKLRDLGDAVGFGVGWSAEKGVYIETK